jgi:hypothetical protein
MAVFYITSYYVKKKVCFVHFYLSRISAARIYTALCASTERVNLVLEYFFKKLKMLHIQHHSLNNIFHANGFILVLLSLNVVGERISFNLMRLYF